MSRFLLHNGLGIYAGWASVASLLNISIAAVYADPGNITKEKMAIVALSILTAELLIWLVLDLSVFDPYTRFLVTPYLVGR